jgi:hypothetical protein
MAANVVGIFLRVKENLLPHKNFSNGDSRYLILTRELFD